jgi:alpha-tubulin suppressor-like RCC1 family protein
MTRWTRLTLGLGVALLAGISCHDSNEGPTDPVASETGPALATTTAAPLAFAQVSAGNMHTCGVTTDSRAYCWGKNTFGQVGDGTSRSNRLRPVPVVGGLRFRQISAGWYNTCGVTTGYRAYCWGNGILRPMAVAGGKFFRQVSTDENHTCGVTTNDQAYCWGINDFGELGDGTTENRATPVAVLGGLNFRAVSVGPYHSCGVTTTDRAYCWGGDRFGEIGDGPAYDTCKYSGANALRCRKTPTLVAGGYRFRQVDAGGGLGPGEDAVGTDGGRTCGVTTDGRAFCWGDGSHGQLGNGTRSMVDSPRRVSGSLQFRSVSAGLQPTCGVTTSNRAYCWGDNTWGAIGDGTTTERRTPTAVAGGLFFRDVSAGGYHACGVTPGNVGYCWGSNGTGSLGDGTTMTRTRPRAVVGPM